MPNHLKFLLSVAVALVAVAVHSFQEQIGQDFNKWLVLGLGAFMIVGVWMFPEPKNRKPNSNEPPTARSAARTQSRSLTPGRLD